MNEHIKKLAANCDTDLLITCINGLKDEVADVRNKILARPEVDSEVRLATVAQLDGLCNQIKQALVTEEPIKKDNWE